MRTATDHNDYCWWSVLYMKKQHRLHDIVCIYVLYRYTQTNKQNGSTKPKLYHEVHTYTVRNRKTKLEGKVVKNTLNNHLYKGHTFCSNVQQNVIRHAPKTFTILNIYIRWNIPLNILRLESYLN